jgi:hypothetical protein
VKGFRLGSPQPTGTKRWPFIVASALGHLALVALVVLAFPHAPKKPPPPPPKGSGSPPDLLLVNVGAPPAGKQPKHDTKLHLSCGKGDDSYHGIGIQFEPWNGNRVKTAPPGLPAAEAGIRVGDRLPNLPPPLQTRMMPAGTVLTLTVIRDTVSFVVKVQVADICYREKAQ